MLFHDKKVVADQGHRGDVRICHLDSPHSEEHGDQMNVTRACHETVNGHTKSWHCMSDLWQHEKEKHHLVFGAVIVVGQLKIMHGESPFQVDAAVDPITAWEQN